MPPGSQVITEQGTGLAVSGFGRGGSVLQSRSHVYPKTGTIENPAWTLELPLLVLVSFFALFFLIVSTEG